MTTHVTLNVTFPINLSVQRLAVMFSGAGLRQLHEAIGQRFAQITRSNFGPAGAHRGLGWPPLSKRYQKRIKYYGPPKLVLKQPLVRSIGISAIGPSSVTVSALPPYASVHQHGFGAIPARPYFPIINGALTPYAKSELLHAAQRAMLGIFMRTP